MSQELRIKLELDVSIPDWSNYYGDTIRKIMFGEIPIPSAEDGFDLPVFTESIR